MMNVCVPSALRRFSLSIAALAATSAVFAWGQGAASTQATTSVSLTAQRMSLTLPDGNTAPMWGFCITGACGGQWTQGPTITVPTGNILSISLKNTLPTPTSIVILGQLGGGLGSPVMVPSPAHDAKTKTTWPTNTTATFTPPLQGNRVQSFGSETSGLGGTNTYTWSALNPGTYLYETGTHPSIQAPMGLYGVIVVTQAPVDNDGSFKAGVACTQPGSGAAISYDSDAVMLWPPRPGRV